MRYLSFMALCFYCLSQTAYSTSSLASKIDVVINKELPHATVAVLIKDAKSGQLIYSKNADKLMAPASNIKLFTAAAALYYWAPEHRFLTQLLKSNEDYFVNFGGSPSLTADNLSQLMLYFKQNKIQHINGNIILDTSRFKPPYYSSGVSYDDLGWYYAAPDTAVILNENTERYELISAKEIGKPVVVNPKTHDPKLTLINQLITVSKEEEKKHCGLSIEIQPNNTLRLYGCIAQTKNPKMIELAVPDPIRVAKQVIQTTLEDNNIHLKGKILDGTTPVNASSLVTFQSPPLSQLLNHMLKESDNLYADNITRQLAYSLTQDGTPKQAVFALKEILSKHSKLDMNQIELADGIGTRYNLVTAEQVVALLTDLYHDKKIFPLVFNALPQSGVSGSLKDRMKKTILEKIVHAKTGSMHDISSLSGYLVTPNGKPIIFSIIINGVNKPINKAKALEEQILTIIEEEINEIIAKQSAYA